MEQMRIDVRHRSTEHQPQLRSTGGPEPGPEPTLLWPGEDVLPSGGRTDLTALSGLRSGDGELGAKLRLAADADGSLVKALTKLP